MILMQVVHQTPWGAGGGCGWPGLVVQTDLRPLCLCDPYCFSECPSRTVCACKLLQSCLTLCDPMDCNPPGSSVHGILQARILEWVAIPPPGDLPDPGIEPTSLTSPALAGRFFTTNAT